MITKSEIFVKINNKGKVQRVQLSLEYDAANNSYIIKRITGQYGGKETPQPEIVITSGKVKRTLGEQANLQYLSKYKEYLDKGYKKLSEYTSKKYSEVSEDDIKELLGLTTTDTAGVPKPMLAKSYTDLSNNILEREYYCSRKIDGVRCLMYFKDGKIHTRSRGGKDYDIATEHLRKNPELISIFTETPSLILDGELYKHGWPLQKISGLCRLQERTSECDDIEYWIYDYISDKPFTDRYKFLMNLKSKFNENSKIKILDHYKLSGYLSIKKLHDKFVQEGFEGLCARHPDKEYGIGKRSGNYLIKLKDYQDAEFEIVGVREGMRPEDMCFVLKTSAGKEFAAKPACDTQTRIYYLNNKEKYIGKMATCKFFYYSNDQVPLQPVFKSIRFDEDLDNA